MKGLVTYLLCIAFLLKQTLSEISLEEYEQMEAESPQMIFEPLSGFSQKQQTAFAQKLIFLTPWNTEGNNLVIKYAHKFDYVSPCWYDLAFSADHIIIENDKLYNKTFIQAVKEANQNIKILPRFYISSNQQALLHSVGSFQAKFKQAIGLIVKIIENQKFDGLVWDSPYNTLIAGENYMGIRNLIVQFVNSIRMNLPAGKMLFFNMANPMGLTLANDMYQKLNVDCLLVQNYDNNQYLPMIRESINWYKSTKFAYKPKLMLLLPFFSRRGGQGIDTEEIQKMYQKGERIGSRIENAMCAFYEYEKRIQSYVPCYYYFKRAFQEVKREGYKMGFWEAGNGLENYYKFL